MSKRTSETLANAIEILDPNNLEDCEDDIEVFEDSELDSPADETPAGGGDDFMHTDDFRRLFVDFVMVDTLVAMRWLDKKWHKVVEKKLTELKDEPFGEIIVHGGNDLGDMEIGCDGRLDRMAQVTKVVFLPYFMKVGEYKWKVGDYIWKVGDYICYGASSLVNVDIPEGITTIGNSSFAGCVSLKDIKFPRSLRSIGESSFAHCYSLERVDLVNTDIRQLGQQAFAFCTNLNMREMTVPDSLHNFGISVFGGCSKLNISVPSDIHINDGRAIVAYLRSIQERERTQTHNPLSPPIRTSQSGRSGAKVCSIS